MPQQLDSIASDLRARDRAQQRERRRRTCRRPSGGNARARGRVVRGQLAPRRRDAALAQLRGQVLLERASPPASFAASGSPGNIAAYSSRKVKRHEGSRPTIGVPAARCGSSAFIVRRASKRASSTMPAVRYVRPQHRGRASSALGHDDRWPAASSTRAAAARFPGSNQPLKVSTNSTTGGAGPATILPRMRVAGARWRIGLRLPGGSGCGRRAIEADEQLLAEPRPSRGCSCAGSAAAQRRGPCARSAAGARPAGRAA